MTKVSIIDVDLNDKVQEIITRNVTALTDRAQKELDTIIEEKKRIKEVKEKKQQEKKDSTDKVESVMNEAYEKLVKAGEDGLPGDIITSIIKGVIPNTSAFSLRMKKILRDNGNEYRLDRVKKNYVLKPFNKEEAAE